jgi:hypothetical protein
MADGKLFTGYGVFCAGANCDDGELGLDRPRERAIQQLTRLGWVKLRGKWFCPDCASPPASEGTK